MGILKGILHHWNKTSKAYDTIHPETEVAQITDWDNGIVNTLASTALGGLVTTLSSDSLLAKLIGKVLTASGARYQSGSNGYICFGSYFGNHIIQWISDIAKGTQWNKYNWPIAVQSTLIAVASGTESSRKVNYITNTSVSIYSNLTTGDIEGVCIIGVGKI